ncbi:acyl carrier protein [Pseudoalteromonas luteoviolacea]|uniref:acyl carrier protein n=1 Tax=Pseudoalteromonas luteoviolacea TaxID=43657 RepID=UPI00114DD4B8|nr:acyl carrier protein [Pseudoalteromonas luteoviolacea]TQF72935.1 acyl carrier protein [Pseudoalteromonas luteoviolacea]
METKEKTIESAVLDKKALVSKVKAVLADVTNDEAVVNLPLGTSLKNDLGIDSMTSLTFLVALEENIEEYSINPDTLDGEHFATIGTICDYLADQLGIN